jgi:putative tryptophan/tyrosine transport system substrate-binding protein
LHLVDPGGDDAKVVQPDGLRASSQNVEGWIRPPGRESDDPLQKRAKKLQLLSEAVPALRHLAIMWNVDNPFTELEVSEVRTAARRLGFELTPLEIRRPEDIPPAFEALNDHMQALYVVYDPVVGTSRVHINTLALGARLPTMHGVRDCVEAGGLMSYGPNLPNMFRRVADHVDKILRGTRPADYPGRATDQVRSGS